MEVFCKKDVLTNLAEFKGKHMCQSLHFHKFAGLRKKKKNKRMSTESFIMHT